MTMGEYEGKTILVTGGTAGIGLAAAEGFARGGGKVIIVGRDTNRGELATVQVGQRARFIKVDVAAPDEIRQLADETGPVDVLVTSSGYRPAPGATIDITEMDFDLTMATNVKGPWFLSALYAPMMAERGGGAIVHVPAVTRRTTKEASAHITSPKRRSMLWCAPSLTSSDHRESA